MHAAGYWCLQPFFSISLCTHSTHSTGIEPIRFDFDPICSSASWYRKNCMSFCLAAGIANKIILHNKKSMRELIYQKIGLVIGLIYPLLCLCSHEGERSLYILHTKFFLGYCSFALTCSAKKCMYKFVFLPMISKISCGIFVDASPCRKNIVPKYLCFDYLKPQWSVQSQHHVHNLMNNIVLNAQFFWCMLK